MSADHIKGGSFGHDTGGRRFTTSGAEDDSWAADHIKGGSFGHNTGGRRFTTSGAEDDSWAEHMLLSESNRVAGGQFSKSGRFVLGSAQDAHADGAWDMVLADSDMSAGSKRRMPPLEESFNGQSRHMGPFETGRNAQGMTLTRRTHEEAGKSTRHGHIFSEVTECGMHCSGNITDPTFVSHAHATMVERDSIRRTAKEQQRITAQNSRAPAHSVLMDEKQLLEEDTVHGRALMLAITGSSHIKAHRTAPDANPDRALTPSLT